MIYCETRLQVRLAPGGRLMRRILFAILLVSLESSAQDAPKPRPAVEYGKDVTLAMLPSPNDPKPVQAGKCAQLANMLIDSAHGNEDLSQVPQAVLVNLRNNTVCGAAALNERDIAKLLSAMSLQGDAANELLQRVSIYAEKEEKDYNDLLDKYKALWVLQSAHVEANSSKQVSVGAGSCGAAIETQIDGDFNGWDDELIYKMTNGEIWQQANYHYHYHYAYRPNVVIYNTSSGCHIKVEDDSDQGVNVIRIK